MLIALLLEELGFLKMRCCGALAFVVSFTGMAVKEAKWLYFN